MTYHGPKVRLARQVGVALTPKAAKVLERRPYPPGDHGRTQRRNPSAYKTQLLEKQKLRYQYNVSERQLRLAYVEAVRQAGPTGHNLLALLESRLDATVLRAGLARTIYAARQFVSHGHLTVNGRKVDRPSSRLRAGDVVAVRDRSKHMAAFHHVADVVVPPYLAADAKGLTVRVERRPERHEIPVICNEALVVELYNR